MTEDRRVAVIGLGYVGLPLAISFVEAGLTVDGVDAFAGRVAELNAGTSPIDDISDERLRTASSTRPERVRPVRDRSCGRRCDLRVRPDADHHDRRIPTSARSCRAARRSAALRAGPAHRPPVDDVPGHDDRPVPRGHRAQRARGRHGLRPRLRARNGSTRAIRPVPARRPAAGRGHDAGRHRARRGAAADHQRQRHRAHPRPTPPSWRSCSRTSSET